MRWRWGQRTCTSTPGAKSICPHLMPVSTRSPPASEDGCAGLRTLMTRALFPRCAHLPPSTATHRCTRIVPVPVPWDSLTDSFPRSLLPPLP
jgi:hypothetical protein